jgi:hypothetical protein
MAYNNFKLLINNPNPMKKTKLYTILLLCQPFWLLAQTGGTCGSAIPIPLDGVTRTFSTSSSTGSSVVCGYAAASPNTWFSFTTNASATMPLLDIAAADNGNCEIAMYTGCTGSNPLQTPSSMCFDDGQGLWAPAHNYTLAANTTYYLRIKTTSATQLTITGQNHSPTNNLCSGATPVGVIPINDNNACNRPSSEVTPAQLCAYTIENTAFYQFYVASTGVAIINISNIACDNGANNNGGGFQIGFFTGSCGALVPLSCTAGAGTNAFVQATTPSLSAGTKVYVAIDGDAGSNCKYSFNAINAFGVLAENDFKNFSVWQIQSANVLKWISTVDKNVHFVVERSIDGSDFTVIGQVSPTGSSGQAIIYKFQDDAPLASCYYRVKQVSAGGQIAMSNTLRIERKVEKHKKLKVMNPARSELLFQVNSDNNETADYTIVSPYGQIFDHGKLALAKGVNNLSKSIVTLPAGHYVLNVSSKSFSKSVTFIKLN